jgi:hypothetical protein
MRRPHFEDERSHRWTAEPQVGRPDSRRPGSEVADPSLPVRTFQSCPTLGTISHGFCIKSSRVRDSMGGSLASCLFTLGGEYG